MIKYLVSSVVFACACAQTFAQDHGHLNVGASGAKLTWDNGADFSPDSGYIKTLTFTNAAKYAGFYQGNITLTAMHSTNAFGNPDPAAPKPGAFIVAEIVSVQGPEGGAFQFWENSSTAGNPTISIPSGTTNSTFRFDLSEAALGGGQPGGDAYGHIHGRRLTATLPGIYSVGFRAYDTSANGLNGAPLHTPSDIQYVQFQAGVVFAKVQLSASAGTVTFGAIAGYNWQLQTAGSLPAATWLDVGSPVLGNDNLVQMDVGPGTEPRRFYRAVGTRAAP